MAKNCGTCAHLDTNNSKSHEYFGDKWNTFYCNECGGYHKETESACRYYQERLKASSSDCFITTTVVELLGYSDNCAVLQTLRGFRDNVLHNNPVYADTLKTYDVIGPEISNSLRNDPLNKLMALSVAHDYIGPICNMIRESDYKTAVAKYSEMVNYLQDRYNIQINIDEYQYDTSVKEEEKGHARALIKPTIV